jgi:hypothetical protein
MATAPTSDRDYRGALERLVRELTDGLGRTPGPGERRVQVSGSINEALPAAERVLNPDPQTIRRWHISNPYDSERCPCCNEWIEKGELINIEPEAGVCHAACSDDPTWLPEES